MPYSNKDDIKKYHKEYFAKWYAKNKQSVIARVRERKKRITLKYKEDKLSKGCAICGYNKSSNALHYHHISPHTKLSPVGTLMAQKVSQSRLATEINKCIVLCSNCHIELHEGLINLPS